MSIKAALIAASLVFMGGAAPSAARAAAAGGEAEAALAAALAGTDRPYAGEIRLAKPGRNGRPVETFIAVSADGPRRWRRETVDERGWLKSLSVSDGKTHWVYDKARAAAVASVPADPDLKLIDPDEELALIARNYRLAEEPAEAVAGRRCDVVSLAGHDGAPVRRLWIDAAEGLILKRVSYAPDGSELSRMEFTRIEWKSRADSSDFEFSPPAGTSVRRRGEPAESLPIEEAAAASGMRPRLPAWLPAGFSLESVNLLPRAGATILHYRFTDGLEVLSLFQAPRRARLALGAGYAGGFKPAEAGVRGARLAAGPEGTLLEWADGDRFWLLGALPARALLKTAESLEARR